MFSKRRSGEESRYGGAGNQPRGEEENLEVQKVNIERKTFIFALKQNPRGMFLRITEDCGGRRDTIIVPATGLQEFTDVLSQMCERAEEPPKR